MNKSKGNMYPWVTHTWNPIRGKCPHDCSYCYMKRYPQPDLHLDEKSLRDDLGSGNVIFVGSSCDMWADDIIVEWIELVLEHCRIHPQNTYLFQSKNPQRIIDWTCDLPPKSLIGTTIETNRTYSHETYKAPYRQARYIAMTKYAGHKMVSIEPIIDFDTELMVDWIAQIEPDFVSIGADSGNNHLPKPPADKIKSLIKELRNITEVRVKDNLQRLTRSSTGS